jgi:hypothetical protein
MIAQVIVPHVEPTIKDIIVPTLKRNFLAKGAATQAAMNELYEAGEFEVHTRYAFVMVHLTVALAYGGGLPHLYLLATLNFAIAFQIDKAFLLKVNNKPPQVSSTFYKIKNCTRHTATARGCSNIKTIYELKTRFRMDHT